MLNSQRPENVRLRAEGGRRTGGEGEPKVGRDNRAHNFRPHCHIGNPGSVRRYGTRQVVRTRVDVRYPLSTPHGITSANR